MDLKQAIAALGKARLYDPCTLCREDIPTMPGVYLWSRKLNGDPAYVGRALGRNGLRGRIWGQHLKLRLECSSDHIANADWYQLAHAVIDENGVHWINKSRLHRNIARVERIAPDKTLTSSANTCVSPGYVRQNRTSND